MASKKPKGSDSGRKILEHGQRVLRLLSEHKPKLMSKIPGFMTEAMKPGVLSRREMELLSLGMALTQQCHYCIALHIRACKQVGITLEEFYLDENGDPI
jgi:AhpD family alkylhydroperoxidase